jgi:tetratricopeptide (TPR) repeat protein
MRRIPAIYIVLGLIFLIPGTGRAESIQSSFSEANNAFWNGEYEKAVKSYERLEGLDVRSAALSYNTGTAHARLGNLGVAVRHYERALRLDPGQVDALHNLNVIREFIARRASEAGRDADLAPAASPWRAVLDRFSPRGATLAFLIFYVALFVVLVARRFVGRELARLSLGVLAGIFLVMAAVTGSVTFGKWHQTNFCIEAIVVDAGQLDIMEGPASKVKRFAIEEGSRVEVLEERNEWIHLRDSTGRDGWTSLKSLGKI